MKKIIFSLLIFFSLTALSNDVRIKRIEYDPNKTFVVHTKIGLTSLIQLEKDESLTVSDSSVLGMGDSKAWDLSVRGNNIIFKQIASNPNTNLIIVTNKRTYSFDLKTITAKENLEPTYILKFIYPDTEAALALKEAERIAAIDKLTAQAKIEETILNTDFVWRGDNENLKPSAAWDDGRFTRLMYDHAGALPVFFKVMPDGSEARINTNIDTKDGRVVVIHDIAKIIRARLNNDVIEIINKAHSTPKFNKHGTSEQGSVRVDNGVLQ